jgi:hypothetical protein
VHLYLKEQEKQDVPGLQLSNIGFLDSRKDPREVAELFVQKNAALQKLLFRYVL